MALSGSNPNNPETMAGPTVPMGSVLLGLLTFSLMDVLMKSLSIELGVYNAIFWRVLVALMFVSIIFFARNPKIPSKAARKIHLQRGILMIFMACLFFWGLARVPLAEAIALSFIAPIIALYLAAVFLKETIHRKAISASILGFSGVLIIAWGRARGGFDEQAFLGIGAILLSAVLYAGNLVIQRTQALLANPIEISFSQNLIFCCVFLLGAPFLAEVPDVKYVPHIVGAGALSVISAIFIAWGYRRAEAQMLINLEYSAFIWAALFGWMFFNEPVTAFTVFGTILIVAGCVLTSRQDRKVAHVETTTI